MAAADQLKSIFAPKVAEKVHKDKLEQTKIRERDIKEAHHRELAAVKNSGAERQREEQQLLKEERILHDTKRAAKDKRDAVKHAKREEAGQTCEHNVYKCKICFPHKVGKPMPA